MLRKTVLVLSIVVMFAAGCQSNLTAKRIQAKNPMAKNSPKTPTKFVDVWNTYAQSTSEGKVMRGVAGRIHFYGDEKKKQAVKVDGDVTVFVFDGDEKDPAHAKPLKVYQFKADALPKHYAFKKPLGHGYDFFLPFDEFGGEEKRLCVMTRFDDRLEGNFVLSQPVNTILQGTKPTPTGPENTIQEFLASKTILGETNRQLADQVIPPEMNPIRQVRYENEVAAPVEQERRSVATVPLNDSLSRRVAQAQDHTPVPVVPTPLPTNSPPSTAPAPKETTDAPKRIEKPTIGFPEPPF